MRAWSEGRRLIVVMVIGLVVVITGAFSYGAWQRRSGPMAGTWRVMSVDGKGFSNVDVRSAGATLSVTNGDVSGRDDINTYTATWKQSGHDVIEITSGTASAAGRGSSASREAQAIDAADTVLYGQGSFHVASHGNDATATRGGVTVRLHRS